MTIEIALLISGLSLAFAIYTGIVNMKRNHKADAQKESSDMTTVIVKLDNLTEKIVEMKTEQNVIAKEIKEVTEKIIILDQSLKSAWKQIDELKARIVQT